MVTISSVVSPIRWVPNRIVRSSIGRVESMISMFGRITEVVSLTLLLAAVKSTWSAVTSAVVVRRPAVNGTVIRMLTWLPPPDVMSPRAQLTILAASLQTTWLLIKVTLSGRSTLNITLVASAGPELVAVTENDRFEPASTGSLPSERVTLMSASVGGGGTTIGPIYSLTKISVTPLKSSNTIRPSD